MSKPENYVFNAIEEQFKSSKNNPNPLINYYKHFLLTLKFKFPKIYAKPLKFELEPKLQETNLTFLQKMFKSENYSIN